MVADISPQEERAWVLAALRAGASLALARIAEVGGSYAGHSDIKTVNDELFGLGQGQAKQRKPLTAAVAEPAPDPADESTRMAADGK
jgi:hypothetical protein